MRKFAALGAVAVLGLAGQTFAAEGFSYNLVEASYVNTDIDGIGDGNGLGLAGSVAILPNFHGFASYSKVDLGGGFDLSLSSLGVGVNWPLNPSLDLVSGLSYERMKIDYLGSESGFGLHAGLRGRVAERMELTGNVKYVDFGHGADDLVLNLGGRYYFTNALAAGLDFSKYDDSDMNTWKLTVRYDFGRR